MENVDTLIIGAGLSGLHLAQLLKKKSKSSLILEKSRGLGISGLATTINSGIPMIKVKESNTSKK